MRGPASTPSSSPRPAPPMASRQRLPMDETHPQAPLNPYGRTKLMVEQALARLSPLATACRSVAPALFQRRRRRPRGAHRRAPRARDPRHPAGARHAARPPRRASRSSATTTTPATARACATTSTCSTWPTPTSAPRAAARRRRQPTSFNLGTGDGTTVRELVAAIERVSGKPFPVERRAAPRGRRPGAGRRQRIGHAGTGLDPGARSRRHHRRRLALASVAGRGRRVIA